ncbi:4-hydroxy-tetrahydrodipicolinate reductase [Jeotgalibacillus campisalis]|uniref:4-hydroxy-tetrahydrodipicolinate reductase n=1 Tax=Jeotgalibacillus campisalis TaxID=220754 RepID=A0A0C2VVP8_9BACL|nr:4-hydroxy-tetrahydrodipicolinate reductase [Jeotgalibacillus campisalis]KIL48043.1 dihydrodipicolinate reductase [Jeotgalibacillus campisalis]
MPNNIKVVIAGPRGRMGREAVKMVTDHDGMQLVSVIDYKNVGQSLDQVEGFGYLPESISIYNDLDICFNETSPDVLIDLTTPETGYRHTKTALLNNVRPVVGTTGFTSSQLDELTNLAEERNIGVIIAPNFAIGAVLMMKFSQMAAKYFEDVEIIEMHHDQKLDAPSGTAIKTAQMIRENRTSKKQGHPAEEETLEGARGADLDGIKIHSVRLPGLIAHQQVLFGSGGQLLTIRHDSNDRASFMSGVSICVETVMNLNTLVYGLENILD